MGCKKLTYYAENAKQKEVQAKLKIVWKSDAVHQRYGFNGKESDFEVKGAGNSYDFGARIYDPRLGRFLSTDPLFKKFSGDSPYSFAGNSPIILLDENGESKITYLTIIDKSGKKTVTRIVDKYAVVNMTYGACGRHDATTISYDVEIDITVDYSNMKDGKPKADVTAVRFKERSIITKVKEALWGFEDNAGTEADGNQWEDDGDTDDDHGKMGGPDPFGDNTREKGKDTIEKDPNKKTDTLGYKIFRDKKTDDTVKILNGSDKEVKKGSPEYEEYNKRVKLEKDTKEYTKKK